MRYRSDQKKSSWKQFLITLYNILAFFTFPFSFFILYLALGLILIFGSNGFIDFMLTFGVVGLASFFFIVLPFIRSLVCLVCDISIDQDGIFLHDD